MQTTGWKDMVRAMKKVPLTELKDDLSNYLRLAETRRSLSRGMVGRLAFWSASLPKRNGSITNLKMILVF